MTKKSNKNSINVNPEKKVVIKKSKRLVVEKKSTKKKLVKTGKKEVKTLIESCSTKATSCLTIPENSITATSKPQPPSSKVSPIPPEPVRKLLQPLSAVIKDKSATSLKPTTVVAGNSKGVNTPTPLLSPIPPLDTKMLNMGKPKTETLTYHVLQKPIINTLEDNQLVKDNNKLVIPPISFAKPYPYPLEPSFNYQLYKEYKQVADVAMRFRKTFMIYGVFPAVRRSLKNRGWVEKLPFNAHEGLMKLTINELLRKMESNEAQKDLCETVIITKMLGTRKPDFIWNNSTHARDAHTFDACQILSRMRHEPQGNFTQKYGLNRCLQDQTWHHIPGEADIKFPRCYNTAVKDQMITFEEDFLLTACVSLLAYIQTKTCAELSSDIGKIGFDTIEFAIAHCNRFLYKSRHLDIDDPIYEEDEDPKDRLTKEDVNDFLYCYYQIVQHEKTFELDENNVLEGLKAESSRLYNSIKNMFPQHFIDGYCNMWLLKPGNQSRGRGIMVLQKLDEIQDEIKKAPRKYVVQKYIERPLLIYGTKFDIRQYFLLTGTCPLTVWMYQDCYLRFSSRIYDLKNFHQAIHLTNNAIQSHYKNEETRSPNLPRENMWHSSTFQQYLADNGCPNAWSKLIYPGMRRCIVGTLLASQEFLDRRNNSFELYGCDFLISEDFTPWLIEINSGPAMSASTSITAKLCPQALEDVIKVVIDYTRNWRAPTGRFELIYRQYLPTTEIPVKEEFLVEGRSLPGKYFHNFTYNEMLKVPSFSHLLRNQPRREFNEYNELLPYVKEKLLRERNLNMDVCYGQIDKKQEAIKRKKMKTQKDKEEVEKKPINKQNMNENTQMSEKNGDANKVTEQENKVTIAKDNTNLEASKRNTSPGAETKPPPPKRMRRQRTTNINKVDDTKVPSKTSTDIKVQETNTKEDANVKPDVPNKPVPPVETLKNAINKVADDIKDLRLKRRKIVKGEGANNTNSPNSLKQEEKILDRSSIDQRKESVDAALSNKPIATNTKTLSCEIGVQYNSDRRTQPAKTTHKKLNSVKIPPSVKVVKTLQ